MTTERDEEEALFREYAESRSIEARNRIVERYAGLAAALARRFDRRGEPLEDLIQVANLALVGAVERFDPLQGAAFSSFATPTVLGVEMRVALHFGTAFVDFRGAWRNPGA